jgi:hypothetical protein
MINSLLITLLFTAPLLIGAVLLVNFARIRMEKVRHTRGISCASHGTEAGCGCAPRLQQDIPNLSNTS